MWNMGFGTGRNGPVITHLIVADDLLLFGQATEEQMQCVKNVLELFCSMSRKQVSNEKTSIMFSQNVCRDVRDKLVHIFGFRQTADL